MASSMAPFASMMLVFMLLVGGQRLHMGTMDYIAERYYQRRDKAHGKDADVHLLSMHTQEDPSRFSRNTMWLGESPRLQLGTYVVEECGFTRGTFSYFCTFDFDGHVLKFDSIGMAGSFAARPDSNVGLRLMEKLSLAKHGGHFLSAVAHGGPYAFFASAGSPASIVTVNLDSSSMVATSSIKLPDEHGGVFAMHVDSGAAAGEQILLAILGKPPVRIALFDVAANGTVSLKAVHEVADDDEAACPSSAFVDRSSKTALIATRGGCVHRVSYAGGTLQAPTTWAKVCSDTASNFRRMAVAMSGQYAVIGSFFPLRQLLLLDLSSGELIDAMPLPNRDVSFVTNIMSLNDKDVYVVGNSMKGMPVVMQLDMSDGKLDNQNWGIIASGHCDEYSWTDHKRKHYRGDDSGTARSYWPIRYYGCTWVPKGRVATGAVLSPDGRLYIAAKRDRCTVCTEKEKEFTEAGGFCVEEFEDYRAPAAECGQHVHNQRPFVRERMLSVAALQRESNSLAGGENFTLIEFQLGKIPERGSLHAPVIKSHAMRSWSKSRVILAAVLVSFGNARLGSGKLAVNMFTAGAAFVAVASLPGAMAGKDTKAFHQHENGCNCLMGCEILGDDSGDCTDDNQKNAVLFEERLAKVGTDDANTCKLMQCIAYCAGPETVGTEMMGRQDELVCASIAKQIGCDIDCSGSYRASSYWKDVVLFVAVVLAVRPWASHL